MHLLLSCALFLFVPRATIKKKREKKASTMFPFHPRCDFCSKPYNNYMSLRNHMRIHGQKRYACELCGKAFRLARYLRNHQKIHDDGPNRFDCPSCCKSFRTMLELAQHRCNAASGQVGVDVCVCV